MAFPRALWPALLQATAADGTPLLDLGDRARVACVGRLERAAARVSATAVALPHGRFSLDALAPHWPTLRDLFVDPLDARHVAACTSRCVRVRVHLGDGDSMNVALIQRLLDTAPSRVAAVRLLQSEWRMSELLKLTKMAWDGRVAAREDYVLMLPPRCSVPTSEERPRLHAWLRRWPPSDVQCHLDSSPWNDHHRAMMGTLRACASPVTLTLSAAFDPDPPTVLVRVAVTAPEVRRLTVCPVTLARNEGELEEVLHTVFSCPGASLPDGLCLRNARSTRSTRSKQSKRNNGYKVWTFGSEYLAHAVRTSALAAGGAFEVCLDRTAWHPDLLAATLDFVRARPDIRRVRLACGFNAESTGLLRLPHVTDVSLDVHPAAVVDVLRGADLPLATRVRVSTCPHCDADGPVTDQIHDCDAFACATPEAVLALVRAAPRLADLELALCGRGASSALLFALAAALAAAKPQHLRCLRHLRVSVSSSTAPPVPAVDLDRMRAAWRAVSPRAAWQLLGKRTVGSVRRRDAFES